ncbi:MAG: glycosyltransferase family 4 protein [Bacteriovoracaceae bacterium]
MIPSHAFPLAITRYNSPSSWKSCELIQEQFLKKNQGLYQWNQNSGEKLPEKIEGLFITDHRWLTPTHLKELGHCRSMKVTLYLYGDFTVRLRDFQNHMKALSGHEVSLVVASDAQKKLVTKIFPEHADKISVVPYPCELDQFSFSPEKRKAFRKKIGLGEEEFLLGFCGRISAQKGIIELVKTVLELGDQFQGKLLLAGPVHEHPFWQYESTSDGSFLRTLEKLKALCETKVIFLGELSRDELPFFYSAIDTFVSSGHFHDEDFNLTLSEAIAARRPCLVSRWGGHHRLDGNPLVKFINMRETDTIYCISEESLAAAITGKEDSTVSPVPEDRPLSPEQLHRVHTQENFLRDDSGKFDIELYRRIYSAYL